MSIIPAHEYVAIMPNGDIKGFESVEVAKGFINLYYNSRVMKSNLKYEYNDITDTNDEFVNTICHNLGVVEGECKLYNTVDIIEEIHKQTIFEDEKQEIISALMSNDIKLNVYDAGIDNIIYEVEPIDIMEPYGSILTDK